MYKFIKEQDLDNQYDTTRVEVQCNATSLPDILEAFESFLRGSGYVFTGTLDIVTEEE